MTLVNNSNVHKSAPAEVGSVRARKSRTLMIDARGGDLEEDFFDSRVDSVTQSVVCVEFRQP